MIFQFYHNHNTMLNRIRTIDELIEPLSFYQALISDPEHKITIFGIAYLTDLIDPYSRICRRFF